MFHWLKSLFTRIEVRVIEVEKAIELPELTAEMKESLRTLQNHTGFQYLLARFRLEKSALNNHFHQGFTLSEREFAHIQSGIHFAGWFEREVARLTQVPRKAERVVSAEEHRVFDEIKSSLELIG